MQALQVISHGNPAQFVEIEQPSPGQDDVLVQIQACGLNFSDLLLVKGTYQQTPPLPFTLGMECAGVVQTVGASVTHLKKADRVAVYCGHGGLAEYGVFPAKFCRIIPTNMSMEQAAGFQIAYGTSHIALHQRAKLKAGETVVVLGAAGGVGLTAVEIAKSLGARVIAVARGPERLRIATSASADHVIDGETANLRDEIKKLGGADVVYDAVGGQQGSQAFRALKPKGRFIIVGFASGDQPEIPLNIALVKNIDLIGLNWGAYKSLDPTALTASLDDLFQLFEDNKLAPVIGQTFPFSDALHALDVLRQRKSTGKIVITRP